MLTVKEVATYLRVSRTTVRRWCHEGTLKSFRLGHTYRIHHEELERHVGISLAEPEAPEPNGEAPETSAVPAASTQAE